MRSTFPVMLVSALLIIGCTNTPVDRSAQNNSTNALEVSEGLSITVQGGSILNPQDSIDTRTDSESYSVSIRAQSLDVRIDISNSVCRPALIHLEVSHVDTESVNGTKRDLYEGVNPLVSAFRAAGQQVVEFSGDPHDNERTPITLEETFSFETADSAPGTIKWTLCTDQPNGISQIIPGHVSRDKCPVNPALFEPEGVCGLNDTSRTQGVVSSPLVSRHRIRSEVDGLFKFAVWGNNGGDVSAQNAIMSAVNAEDVRFSIINGDLTKAGLAKDLKGVRNALDAGLNMPWFATLGDRDILGDVADDYTSIIGSSNFAFDVANLRIVVLDSADRSLTRTTLNFLTNVLSSDKLWWNTTTPSGQFVITHTPPFDPFGARDLAFKMRSEGASFLARLIRTRVGHLVTSQFEKYETKTIEGLDVIHAGGAMKSDAPYWLLVTVDPNCIDETQRIPHCERDPNVDVPCPCLKVEKREVE